MRNKKFGLAQSRYTRILFASASVLLVVFAILTILPPVETEIASATIDGTVYDLTLTTNDSVNLELTPTTEGSVAIAKDTISATTNSPSGYKLYVSTNSTNDNNIYLNGNDTNNTDDMTIKGTTGTYESPAVLNTNNDSNLYASWGYAVAGLNNFDDTYSTTTPSSSSKFAGLPTKNNEQLIRDHEGTASSDTTEIYYGVKANTNLSSGDYQTEILYTTLTDTSSIVDGEATITPNELEEGYETTTATIQTSLKTTRELGTISVTIGNQACTNVTVTNESPVALECTIPTGLEAGEYNVEVNFTRLGKTYTIANGLTINEPILDMQSMTPELCSSLNLEQQYQFRDTRDNKLYWVAKLKDGKCWMTQNLDLNLSTGTTLTNQNTDLNSVSSWTPTRSTIDATSNMTTSGTSATNTGWADDCNTPYSLDPGNVYFDGTYYSGSFSSLSCDYLTTNCEHFKNTKQTLNNEHGHVGNYYNWSAVVASNNTASFTTNGADYPDSICPKGWRLPNNYSSTSSDLATLNTAYGGIASSDQTLLSTPLFFVRAGGVWSSALRYAASYGYYWSSTVDSSSNARGLYLYSNYVNPSNYGNRGYEFSARCVARKPITITWDANGGTVDPATTTKESGSAIGTLPTPTYDGYNFLGWFTEATGGTEVSTSTAVTGNITYYAHWEKIIITFDQAFANAGKSKQSGYYKMQDMTSSICSAVTGPTTTTEDISTQLIDTRDSKVYWVSKLKDGKCWMTQNLDLNLSASTTLTNENTDLNSVSSWTPTSSTIDVTSNMTTTGTSATIADWANDTKTPYSVDPGNVYFDGTYFASAECNYLTTNCEHFKNTKQTLNNEHGHVGNYYNWSAVVASNNTASFTTDGADYPDSICPKGWRLPHGGPSPSGNDYGDLVTAYGNPSSDQTLLSTPLFFVRTGRVWSGALYVAADRGHYWSSTVTSSVNAYSLDFYSDRVYSSNYFSLRDREFSARCVAR